MKNRGFWLIAAAFFVTMLGTTLPTPLYPLYEKRFGFAPFVITVIFATYAVGVIAGLVLFGHLSDRIGRRRVLLPGLAFSALSAATFLLAHGLPPILLGRLFSGLSAGMFTGAGTAALLDFVAENERSTATLVAVAVNIGGLACGPLLAGLLSQYAGLKLRLPYAVDLVLLLPATLGVFAAPEMVDSADRRFRLSVQRLRIPPEMRDVFVRAAIAGVCGFAVAGLFSAVAPTLLGTVLHVTNRGIAGTLVFLFFAIGAAGQVTVRHVSPRFGLALACALLTLGLVPLMVAIAAKSAVALFVAATIDGFAEGLAVGVGLAQINERVAERRGEVISTYWVLLYVGLAVPVVGVGVVASFTGLPTAGYVFCTIVATALLAVLASLLGPEPKS